MKRMFIVLLTACPLLLCGCAGTFKEVKPLSIGPVPNPPPTMLVIGDIRITDTNLVAQQYDLIEHAFRVGVEKWCAENHGMQVALASSSNNPPSSTVVLSGEIKEVNEGSASERFWVGMGAGQARTRGEFCIQSSDGSKLMTFTARESYLGGAGIGGWDMMSMEDLVDRLGQLVAETTFKWIHGEKLE